jgi:hypothetical protein
MREYDNTPLPRRYQAGNQHRMHRETGNKPAALALQRMCGGNEQAWGGALPLAQRKRSMCRRLVRTCEQLLLILIIIGALARMLLLVIEVCSTDY